MDSSERSYSAFWPVLIFLVIALLCYLYQLHAIISQRSAVDQQLQQAQVEVPQAKAAQDRLLALINDLAKTATTGHNENAMRIMNEAKQAGIFSIRPNAPASTNAAPANP